MSSAAPDHPLSITAAVSAAAVPTQAGTGTARGAVVSPVPAAETPPGLPSA